MGVVKGPLSIYTPLKYLSSGRLSIYPIRGNLKLPDASPLHSVRGLVSAKSVCERDWTPTEDALTDTELTTIANGSGSVEW